MTVELAIVWVLMAGGVVPLVAAARSAGVKVGLGLAALALGYAAWAWQGALHREEAGRERLRAKAPREGRPGGYVGSSACRACHPGEFQSWHNSFHRTMTQFPGRDNVRGDFSGVTEHFDGDTYRFEKDAAGYWVEMVDPDWKYARLQKQIAHREGRGPAVPAEPNPPRSRLPVTLMTGSHHMQTYWVPSRVGNLQYNVPFTYVFEARRWAPRHDVFLLNPDKHYAMQVWNTVCQNCHATAGQPRQDPKTSVLESRAAEMGIACEACHGPGEEHVKANESPLRRYTLHRRGAAAFGVRTADASSRSGAAAGDPTIFNPGRAGHVKASEACSQCHSIRLRSDPKEYFLNGMQLQPGGDIEGRAPLVHYEDPNLPGTPERKRAVMEGCFWADGQLRVSGRDFNGMEASACYRKGELSCLSCHSMHGYQSAAHQLSPGMESNAACLQCHTQYAVNVEAHTHHRANSSGSLCYNCHMPHTSYGLLKAIRSHKITVPNVRETSEAGRPNACNLCHLDRSLAWTAERLSSWYRQASSPLDPVQTNVSAAALLLLRGDAGQRAVVAWHAGWAEATAVSGRDWLAPYLAQLLVDPYSVVRYIAQRSLRRLPEFKELNYDYIGPAEQRERARVEARRIWEGRPAAQRDLGKTRAPVLLRADGALDEAVFGEYLRQRNDRKMELIE